MVIARALDGDIGILANHIPMVAALDIWPLRIISDGVERKMAVSGGVFSVTNNKIVIMTATAEFSEDIDVDRAKRALARANEELAKAETGYAMTHWENAVRRAEMRLKIAHSKH